MDSDRTKKQLVAISLLLQILTGQRRRNVREGRSTEDPTSQPRLLLRDLERSRCVQSAEELSSLGSYLLQRLLKERGRSESSPTTRRRNSRSTLPGSSSARSSITRPGILRPARTPGSSGQKTTRSSR